MNFDENVKKCELAPVGAVNKVIDSEEMKKSVGNKSSVVEAHNEESNSLHRVRNTLDVNFEESVKSVINLVSQPSLNFERCDQAIIKRASTLVSSENC